MTRHFARFFDHRARAAFRADSLRWAAVSFACRRFDPILPPRAPCSRNHSRSASDIGGFDTGAGYHVFVLDMPNPLADTGGTGSHFRQEVGR